MIRSSVFVLCLGARRVHQEFESSGCLPDLHAVFHRVSLGNMSKSSGIFYGISSLKELHEENAWLQVKMHCLLKYQ